MTQIAAQPIPPLDEPPAWPGWLRMVLLNIPLVLLVFLLPAASRIENPDLVDPYHARVLILIGLNITLAVSLQLINGISGQFSLGHAGFMAIGAYMAGFPTTNYGKLGETELANPFAVLWFFIVLLVALALAGGAIAGLFSLIRRSKRLWSALPGLLLLAVIAWFVWDLKMSANLESHSQSRPWYLLWSHFFTLVQTVYSWLLAHGMPAATWLSSKLPTISLRPITMLFALIGGGVLAAIAGLVVGLPTLRLRGDYLAIATLGFSEIIRVCIVNADALGKATGLQVPPYAAFPDPDERAAGAHAYFILPWVFGVAVVTILLVWRLAHSQKGRAIKAVREDEIAAAAVGIDTTHHKIVAFMIGAFFAGVAGALHAHYDGYLNPNSFGLMRSIELVVIVTLGGLGSIWGAVLAAIVLTFLPEFLRSPAEWLAFLLKPAGVQSADALHMPPWLLDVFAWTGENRMVVYSLLLVLIMLAKAATNRNGKGALS